MYIHLHHFIKIIQKPKKMNSPASRLKAPIYKYFGIKDLATRLFTCNFCKHDISAPTTSNLIKHYERKKPSKLRFHVIKIGITTFCLICSKKLKLKMKTRS
jgi:hypothetical protein